MELKILDGDFVLQVFQCYRNVNVFEIHLFLEGIHIGIPFKVLSFI